MKKQKLFKTFRCLYTPDCFAINRLTFHDSQPEYNEIKKLETLKDAEGTTDATKKEIEQAVKEYKTAERLVQTYTDKYSAKIFAKDYTGLSQIQTYLEEAQERLKTADAKIGELLDKNANAVGIAMASAKKVNAARRKLIAASAYDTNQNIATNVAPGMSQQNVKGRGISGAALDISVMPMGAVRPAGQTAKSAETPTVAGEKKTPEKQDERTAEQKFQLMMDKYVGAEAEKLISAEDFAKALNSVDNSTTWNAEGVLNKGSASDVVQAVEDLQKKLNADKSARLDVDGIFGRKTFAAYSKEQPVTQPKVETPVSSSAPKPDEATPAPAPESVPTAPAAPVEEKTKPEAPKPLPDTTVFYELKDDINELPKGQRSGFKEFDVVIFVENDQENPELIKVQKTNGDIVSFQKDYLENLGDIKRDYGTSQKLKFLADFYNTKMDTKVDTDNLRWTPKITITQDDASTILTDQLVEWKRDEAGGFSTVILEDGREAKTKTENLNKANSQNKNKINQYIINRYKGFIEKEGNKAEAATS